MKLSDVGAPGDLARLAEHLPGLDPDRIVVRRIPAGIASRWSGIQGMALGRTIWVNDTALLSPDLPTLLAHEAVHVAQWRRHGTLGFLVRYCADYLRGRAAGLGHAAAYRAIPAEVEARVVAKAFGAERPE